MTSKKTRALFALAVALLMVFSFAACGKGAANPPSASAGASQQAQASPQPSQPAKPVNLVVWFPNPGGDTSSPARTKLNNAFMAQYPNVKIDEVVQPNDNYDELIKAANLAGNGPDILELWPGTPTTNYAKFLVPLNKYLGDDFMKNYYGWNLARAGFGNTGDVYGIPYGAYVYCIWYNKELMAKAGVTDTDYPKTWDELLAVCEKLKQLNIVPFCIGTKDGYMLQWGAGALLCTIMGNDGIKVASPDYKFTGSEVQKATELWQELGQRGYVIKDTASISTGDDQDQRFASGGGAMLLSGSWEMATLQKAMPNNLGLLKFPAADPNNPNKDFNYAGPGTNFCVTNYSKNIDMAVNYIKALSSDTYQMDECNERGDLPTNLSVDASKITNPLSKQFYDMLKSGQNAVILDLINLDAYNEYVRMGSLITTGKMTAEAVCQEMDKIVAKAK